MSDRPRFFDDLAGVAGGAMSALAGLREEAEAVARSQLDEAIRRLDLVRRSELDAVQELAANARAGQEAAEAKLAAVESRLAAMEERNRSKVGRMARLRGEVEKAEVRETLAVAE